MCCWLVSLTINSRTLTNSTCMWLTWKGMLQETTTGQCVIVLSTESTTSIHPIQGITCFYRIQTSRESSTIIYLSWGPKCTKANMPGENERHQQMQKTDDWWKGPHPKGPAQICISQEEQGCCQVKIHQQESPESRPEVQGNSTETPDQYWEGERRSEAILAQRWWRCGNDWEIHRNPIPHWTASARSQQWKRRLWWREQHQSAETREDQRAVHRWWKCSTWVPWHWRDDRQCTDSEILR